MNQERADYGREVRLEQLTQAGDELKSRVSQSLDQTQQRIAQIEDEAKHAAISIQEGKDQALGAARNAMDETERRRVAKHVTRRRGREVRLPPRLRHAAALRHPDRRP